MDDSTLSDIGKALGRIPSGCAILPARSRRGATGMLASWVQQTAFEPPAVTVAVKKGRPIESYIDESGGMALNLIGEDPSAMFRHFGRGFGPGEEAFEGLQTRAVDGGIALDGAIAVLSCRVTAKHDAGDHWLYIAHVTAAEAPADGRPYVHLRKNGLGY
ncbi:MAG: flavin reductase family protein [Phycisphaerae bacterium]